MQDQEKIVKYLVSVEKISAEILTDQRAIIELDKRRNHNREALRDLSKSTQRKCWVTVGAVLVKHSVDAAKSLLEADQKQINIDLNKLRSELKVKVNVLRDLEMQPPVPGLMLVAMSTKETQALSKAKLILS